MHHWCAVSQQSDITSALLYIISVEGSFATKLAMSIFPNVDIKTHTQTSHPQKQNKWLEIHALECKCKQKTTINPLWNIWIWRPSWHAQIYDYAEMLSCMYLIYPCNMFYQCFIMNSVSMEDDGMLVKMHMKVIHQIYI